MTHYLDFEQSHKLMSKRRGRLLSLAAGLVMISTIMILARGPGFLKARGPLARGTTAYDRGDWRGALEEGRKLLKATPDNRPALRLMACASARLGRDAQTEALYLRLGVEGAEAEDFFLLGKTLLRQGQEGPGLRLLEQARDRNPSRPEILQTLSQEYRRLDLPIVSAEAARKLAETPGSGVTGHWLRGMCLMELDEPAAAAKAFQFTLDHDTNGLLVKVAPSTIRKQLVRAWLRCGRAAEARDALAPLLAEQPDREAFWLSSRVALWENNRKAAAQALEKAGGFGDDDPTIPEPAPWVGHFTCATCHPKIHQSQQGSRHARTLCWGPRLEALPLRGGAIVDPGNTRVQHHLTAGTKSEPVRVEAKVDGRLFSAVILYLIGSGNRGQTPIVRDNAVRYWEYRLTRYALPADWDTTIHHPARPQADSGYLGRPIPEDEVRHCLKCHATNPDAVRQARPEATEARGIDCERCHGPGGNHLQAMKLNFPDVAIAQPRLASGAQRGALCAQCHRAPRGTPADLPDFVRFQSPNLARSRCSIESDGKMDCITCHDPHRDAKTEHSFFEAICLNCHGEPGARNGRSDAATHESNQVPARSCSVNPTHGCVGCHMPRVSNVIPHTSYTDHFIRIRRN